MRRTVVTLRVAGIVATGTSVLLLSLPVPAAGGQDARAVVCPALDRTPREIAAVVEPLGDAGRNALVAMASGAAADTACGLAGLAAVRDPRVVPLLVAAIQAAPADAEVWRLVRWAAFLAGGPDPALGAGLAALIATFELPAARAAAGDDVLRLLGELDVPAARARLVAEFDRPLADGAIDAAIHALARQREPRPRARVAALGAELAAGLAGNATYEQARRLGAVAFYQLVLGLDTRADGLSMLARLAPEDRADTAAWAMQTLCEQGVRRPDSRESATAVRASLGDALSSAGVRWDHLARGAFLCPPEP
ncbi:MAG: hypothetical protein KA371_16275 [Acidobacteria bacterium]|nr:hypothetical protein [Acidobacteriota bacterium]